ncbi:MAG TPA: hypothetical protein VKI00_24740 [Mycobacterium sp.]|uniref:hypothetical protein n=1 Tax=Mycobacterium sp. TaxID=1785 RepID=UPI002CBACBED|nr:hypothetical protein [Mycobacterium sp.]HME78741.1 hypothetical protein [Mycobacterium sp.]
MIDDIEKMMMRLPSVKGKNAAVACIVGFIFGGIGLAVYFRNVVDLVFPVAVAFAASLVIGALNAGGWLAGALFAALYGYFRVQLSEQQAGQLEPR